MIGLFRPLLAGAQFGDRVIACIGAALCLALTAAVCAHLPFTPRDLPAIVAPLGASAVLVFAVPASPLAQPWPVIGGASVHAAGFGFALAPVAINSVALAALGMAFHRMSGHSYPHRAAVTPAALDTARTAAGFHADDIDRALADMPDGYDIDRANLDLLLSRAELHARARLAR